MKVLYFEMKSWQTLQTLQDRTLLQSKSETLHSLASQVEARLYFSGISADDNCGESIRKKKSADTWKRVLP